MASAYIFVTVSSCLARLQSRAVIFSLVPPAHIAIQEALEGFGVHFQNARPNGQPLYRSLLEGFWPTLVPRSCGNPGEMRNPLC